MGRSGFACADCHPVDAPRPAPALGNARPERIDWCTERFLRRPPLPPRAVGDLLAAIPALPTSQPVTGDGAAAFAAACGHCHLDGPAPEIVGEPWSDDALRARVRGTDRPAHPDTLMPAFPPHVLDDATLDAIVAHLARAARPE